MNVSHVLYQITPQIFLSNDCVLFLLSQHHLVYAIPLQGTYRNQKLSHDRQSFFSFNRKAFSNYYQLQTNGEEHDYFVGRL